MFQPTITPEEIENLPFGCFPGEIAVIDNPGHEYRKAIAYLLRQKYIGFDTETRPTFAPGQKNNGVALLQLSGPGKAFLFRVQTLGMRKGLRHLLSSRRILKIGAATRDDVRGLQKIEPFQENGFIDLQKIVGQWGIADKSVKKMAAIILGLKISKSQQLSNWEAEQLSDSQIKYAATDAWVCREMYLKLNDKDHIKERKG